MWKALETAHVKRRPGARFNAYNVLFSLRKSDDESLTSLASRIGEAMRTIQNLRPTGFTPTKLDDELQSMALVRALPESYTSFIDALLLKDDLDKDKIIDAFQTLEITRSQSSSSLPLSTALSASSAASANVECEFCGIPRHTMAQCFKYQRAQKEARKPRSERKERANKAADNASTSAASSSTSNATEFAGSASLRPPRAEDPLSPLQLDADVHWNADTGATSHMTPHRHWLRNYKPLRVPIRLADNQVDYSASVGTVVFRSTLEGREGRDVEFTRVLHVPARRNNLLSVLFLTKCRDFAVTISSARIDFAHNGRTLFCAPISEHNTAHLSGITIPAPLSPSECTAISSTLALDESLWHRRLTHANVDALHKLVSKGLVTGIVLASKTRTDSICEPCLAGKMHANPFPPSASRARARGVLVHSDLKGPMLKQTHQGFKYWMRFVDDYSRFRVVFLLKRKSDAFAAFRTYKSWVETQTGERVRCLRNDKGGEYMSEEFNAFCAEHGIERQHSVRNRPQQNGVAERTNRTLADGVTAMLAESGLPQTFWGEAVLSLVHVLNRSFTSACPDVTPYELWYGRKSDVSLLRVWGCTAYVHVQKDKHKGEDDAVRVLDAAFAGSHVRSVDVTGSSSRAFQSAANAVKDWW